MALMLAELPQNSFRRFSAPDQLEACSGFEPFTALVHGVGAGDLSRGAAPVGADTNGPFQGPMVLYGYTGVLTVFVGPAGEELT